MTSDTRPHVILVGGFTGISPTLFVQLQRDLKEQGVSLATDTVAAVDNAIRTIATALPELESLCVADVFSENRPKHALTRPMAKGEFEVTPPRERNSECSPAKRLLQRQAEKNRRTAN